MCCHVCVTWSKKKKQYQSEDDDDDDEDDDIYCIAGVFVIIVDANSHKQSDNLGGRFGNSSWFLLFLCCRGSYAGLWFFSIGWVIDCCAECGECWRTVFSICVVVLWCLVVVVSGLCVEWQRSSVACAWSVSIVSQRLLSGSRLDVVKVRRDAIFCRGIVWLLRKGVIISAVFWIKCLFVCVIVICVQLCSWLCLW